MKIRIWVCVGLWSSYYVKHLDCRWYFILSYTVSSIYDSIAIWGLLFWSSWQFKMISLNIPALSTNEVTDDQHFL